MLLNISTINLSPKGKEKYIEIVYFFTFLILYISILLTELLPNFFQTPNLLPLPNFSRIQNFDYDKNLAKDCCRCRSIPKANYAVQLVTSKPIASK